jgi:hypothetical protein
MEFEMLTFENVHALYEMFIEEDTYFVNILGLDSIHERGLWLHVEKKESYLKIIDKKKWFLAKIKYGI